jgi:hypothetical protein
MVWRSFLNSFNFRKYSLDYDYSFNNRGHISYLQFNIKESANHLYTAINGSRFYSKKEFVYIIPPGCNHFQVSFHGKKQVIGLPITIPSYFKTDIVVQSCSALDFRTISQNKFSEKVIRAAEPKLGYHKQTSKITRQNRIAISIKNITLKHYTPKFKEL